jgi:hypothetical protein
MPPLAVAPKKSTRKPANRLARNVFARLRV